MPQMTILKSYRFVADVTFKTSTLFQNDPPSFVNSSKISPHSSVTLSHTVYYECLCRLRRHCQVGRLLFQGMWLSLVTQSAIRGSIVTYKSN